MLFFKKTIPLVGIDHVDSPQKTMGTVEININLHKKDHYVRHQFQVVPDSFFLKHDGILGNDFICKHRVVISAPENRLKIGDYFIPTHNEILKNTKPDLSICKDLALPYCMVIPPRSETFAGVKITNPEIGFGIMHRKEIFDNVFFPSAILKVNSAGYSVTTIVNLNENKIFLNTLEVTLEPLEPEYFIGNCSGEENIEDIDALERERRFERILESIDLSSLNTEEKNSLLPILSDFEGLFHLEGDVLTHTNILKHKIRTSTDIPVAARNYRYPYKLREEVKKQIEDMLRQGIIAPSTSPWNAPIWIVPKKAAKNGEKKWRLVIDYRELNKVAIGDSHPLPNIVDILDQLGRARYFSTIDLASGYYQIETDEIDAEKTVFSTETGHYQFTRMPMGLKNSAATFQRLMYTVLSGLVGSRCFVYLDDIVIYAESIEEHSKKLYEVFSQLALHNLKINPKKTQFLSKKVTYLGHKISSDGCRPDKERIESIVNFEPNGLQNVKMVKQFLGIIGFYRRFIPKFSEIALPLTRLLRKDVPFVWTVECQDSFNMLKAQLTSDPLLRFPDFSKPYTISTDASGYAMGAILQQQHNGQLFPIAYYSRALNTHEVNYSVIEKETLAIVSALNHFRPYLYGNQFKIQVRTDHKPLKWLFNCKNPGSRLLRWRLQLEEFEYEIDYIPGNQNLFADALSRDSRFLSKDKHNTDNCENVVHSYINTLNDFDTSALEDEPNDFSLDNNDVVPMNDYSLTPFQEFIQFSNEYEIDNPRYQDFFYFSGFPKRRR